jgi:hypothetical protein
MTSAPCLRTGDNPWEGGWSLGWFLRPEVLLLRVHRQRRPLPEMGRSARTKFRIIAVQYLIRTNGLFTRKPDFALGLKVYKANNLFLYSEMT